jgi:thiamine kinase-like enzyme
MDAKLVVIDYEFCSYNFRAFDIANHLTEWIFDYNNKDYPYYFIAKDKFPGRDTMVFITISTSYTGWPVKSRTPSALNNFVNT